MQAVRSLATFGAVLALASTSFARTFTSADGSKTMDGKLTAVSVQNKTATIKRVDGKSITFPLSAVSSEDQTYIKDWYKGTAALRNLSVNIKQQDVKGTETKTSNARRYTITSKYALNIRSNAPFEVNDLDVKYRIFYKKDKEKSKDLELTADGSTKIDSLMARGEMMFTTDPVSLSVQKPLPAQQCKGGG